jgi:CheY-like chemotaxis protein/signal transduction histidine kinase/methyl-accepting chemotaxis protein
MRSIVRFKKVRSWLTLWILVLALLPVIITSVIIYKQRVEVIRSNRIQTLTAVRDLKVRQVESWLDERLGDGQIVAGSQEIEGLVKSLKNGHKKGEIQGDTDAIRALLNRQLEGFQAYEEIFLLDSLSGKVLVSTNREDENKPKADYPYFAETLKKRQTVISDIYFSKTLHRPSMVISTPIVDLKHNSKIIAILVARIDLENTIYALLRERTGMGETGETLIVNNEGMALNDLRWREKSALSLKITALPAMLAIQGHKGIIEGEDYRGVKVLAAYTYLPQVGWGFVSKQDSSEVFAPIQAMLHNVLILVGLFAGAIIFCALYIGNRITAPILAMKDVSTRLQEGDLAARNVTDRDDELGYLSQSINTLAASIEAQINVQKGSGEIIESLVSTTDVRGFAEALLKKLKTATNSHLAVFYLRSDDGQTFQPMASIGSSTDALKAFDTASQEGELGVALMSKKIEHITTIPEDTRFTFSAVAGQALPREIITLPLLDRAKVKAIVSLANLKEYSEESLKILQICWLPICTALVSVLTSDKTQLMASELLEKNEELTDTNEELQRKSEELQTQSAELQAQSQELRETADELETQRSQVKEADRLKSEFLSNMSHELRTPLNSVLALSQLMISRGTGKDPAEEKNFLEVIERNGRQLLNLINDILDLSKIESGRMDIFPSTFDSRRVINRALDTIRPLLEEKGQSLEVNIEAAPEIESDEDKVTQILLNLLSNATKFTARGRIMVEVTVSAQRVFFIVRDTGIGIRPEDFSHIFDEFRQVDGSVTRRHEGTGLGLAICQKLAVLLGGQILVESVEGEGSTFTLDLPLQIPASGNIRPVPLPTGKPSAATTTQQTILVIDDEQEVLDLVGNHLTEAGYRVVLASNGKEGIRLAKEFRPFAITLDVLMRGMDGWEVLKELKTDPATTEIPVVMLSVSEDRETGMALGASGYLTKPVDKNILVAEIEKVVCTNEVKRILVVDDDPVARNYAQSALEQKGYLVAVAEGGEMALRLIKDTPPDVVLLDLMMPDMDGFSVLDKVRKDPACRDLPVIVLTAKDLTLKERSYLNTSVRKILTKSSLNKDRLLNEIVSTLQELGHNGPDKATAGQPLILVVEDNETAALQVKTALEDNGYAVTIATGGEEALENVKRVVPDGVVLDLMMPGLDGFQVLETIRSTPWSEHLPVLILTAKELTSHDRSRLKNQQVKQLIQKGSVDREQLVAAVREMIEPAIIEPAKLKVKQERNRTVLVVEDNPDNLLTVTSTLAQENCTIITAGDGKQAVKMVQEENPGLVLMDMQLPEMSGMEAVRRIKANPELTGIPIVALTANAMKGDREKTLAAGCDDYLSKPFDPVELQEMVRKWLD